LLPTATLAGLGRLLKRRMEPATRLLQLVQADEQIPLRRRQMSVPKHEADGIEVRTTLQQMAGEGPPHVVGDDALGETGSLGILLEHPPDFDSTEGMAGPGKEQAVATMGTDQPGPLIPQVLLDGGGCPAADGHKAFASAFAETPQIALIQPQAGHL